MESNIDNVPCVIKSDIDEDKHIENIENIIGKTQHDENENDTS